MNEAEFIAALRALPLHAGARGLADDAAVLEIGGETLILTHDAMIEGTHYLVGTDPADIAWKLIGVNLSDLAAKGAAPIGVLIGASLIEGNERFVAGLGEALAAHGVPLLGGDTISAPPRRSMFGCTAIGRATSVPVPSRSGAGPGDSLWVTGVIGAARDACAAIQLEEPRAPWHDVYLRPSPRLAEGQALAPYVRAMMDVSDGLLLDASRMAEASGCAVTVMLDAVPFPPSDEAVSEIERLRAASWGDDYELLFAAAPDFAPPVPATRIGGFAPGKGLTITDKGAPVAVPERLGYLHTL